MEIFAEPELWVAVAFVIFVVAAGKPIARAIAGGLDSRAAKIKAQLDEARSLREEAERLLAEHQRQQREALKGAEQILAHARSEAERLRRQGTANLDAALARREKMALEKIAQAEAQAVADVRNQAIDLATTAAARLLRESVDKSRGDTLIDAAIADLDRKLH
jgi:F-type H+-transporting ATPase subunit b